MLLFTVHCSLFTVRRLTPPAGVIPIPPSRRPTPKLFSPILAHPPAEAARLLRAQLSAAGKYCPTSLRNSTCPDWHFLDTLEA